MNGVSSVSFSLNNLENARLQNRTQQIEKGISNKSLYNACVDFESLFVKQMLNSMRSTIDKSSLLDGGMAQNIFEDMLYDEYANQISKSQSLGLATKMYNQLLGINEFAPSKTTALTPQNQGSLNQVG